MNPEDLQFKDKEIASALTTANKEAKTHFGASFKKLSAAPTPSAPDSLVGTATPTLAANSSPVVVSMSGQARPVSINPAGPAQNEAGQKINPVITPPIPKQGMAEPAGPQPTAEELEKKEFYSIVKPLRTYERDVADAIRAKNESVATIKIASENKRIAAHEPIPTHSAHGHTPETATKNGLFIMLTIVLILGTVGIGGLVYYFYTTRPDTTVTPKPTPVKIITTNQKERLDVNGKSAAEVAAGFRSLLANTTAQGNLVEVELTQTDPIVGSITVASQKFFELFGANAPASLSRAMNSEWLLGFHSTNSASVPFVLFKTDSFDIAYDGMLRWEESMQKDLEPIFGQSTTDTFAPSGTSKKFEDLLIRNKDTRVLRNSIGNIVLLYSFLDQKHLVITTNEETFREILNRFFASHIVR